MNLSSACVAALIVATAPLAGCVAVAPQMAHPSSSSAALASDIGQMITAAEAKGFSGVIVVEQDGKPVLRKAIGFADREARR
ncbi:MAG: hypothetical protein ABIO80_01615, partial [Sphingomicrobium sp.]